MRHRISLPVAVLALALSAGTAGAKDFPKVELLPDQMLFPTAWVQSSAEYRALTISIYNMAKVVLDMKIAEPADKPKAIVIDIDETVLDNSPYQAMTVERGTGFPHGWFDWVDAAVAEPVPGALDFLRHADAKGVKIFYLSNRKVTKDRAVPGLENTMKNLAAVGAPQVVEEQMYLRSGSSSKEERRQAIAKDHTVLMHIGDNLNDHSDDFKGKSIAERKAAVDAHGDAFGTVFIVLPNPMYGEFEGAIYSGNWRASPAEKVKMRREAMSPWRP